MLTRSFDLAVTAVCLSLLAYIGWSYQEGPHSAKNFTVLSARIAALETELKDTSAERQRRDARVALLRPESLDPDMLDEMARRVLDYTAPNELVLK